MTDKTEETKTEEEVKETDKQPDKKADEKTLTESQVNALMAKERKSYEAKLKTVNDEYAAYKKSIEDKAAEAEAAAKEKVEKLREGLPEGIVNLLDKLTAVEQLEWLSDPANTIEKKTIHQLPEPNVERARLPSIGTIV